MGKRIITQRRGRGTSTYKAHSHRKKYRTNYPNINQPGINGTIMAIEHDCGREAPLALIRLEDRSHICIPAPEGIRVGGSVVYGGFSPDSLSITELGSIPEGTLICNIEKSPGSGGSFCRTPGAFARLLSKTDNVIIQFSSKKQKKLNFKCRAVIGIVAGGGKLEKPSGTGSLALPVRSARWATF